MNGIIKFTAEQIDEYRQALTSLLQRIVNHGASIGWLAPLCRDDALEYWATVRKQVAEGTKLLLVAQEGNLPIAAVQLALEARVNGNHRAEVRKLMVHVEYRRRGIAGNLMYALARRSPPLPAQSARSRYAKGRCG